MSRSRVSAIAIVGDWVLGVSPKSFYHPRAFTLVELLIVISVITLLIAILLPALTNAREAARTVGCHSNQRQLGIGIQAYRTDFDDYFPGVQLMLYNDGLVVSNKPFPFLIGPYLGRPTTNLPGGGQTANFDTTVIGRHVLYCPNEVLLAFNATPATQFGNAVGQRVAWRSGFPHDQYVATYGLNGVLGVAANDIDSAGNPITVENQLLKRFLKSPSRTHVSMDNGGVPRTDYFRQRWNPRHPNQTVVTLFGDASVSTLTDEEIRIRYTPGTIDQAFIGLGDYAD